jgi:hypothetical protein
VSGGSGQAIHLALDDTAAAKTLHQTGTSGKFTFHVKVQRAGNARFAAQATSGGAAGGTSFSLTTEPPLTAIQPAAGLGTRNSVVAPGCRTCLIGDRRGDDLGMPPDIKSAASRYSNGWYVHTITTYGPIRIGGTHPCLTAYWGRSGPGGKQHGFTAGCVGGPHDGMIFGDYNICGPHMDANDDCGPARITYPNDHTMVLRFRAAQIGNPAWYLWDVSVWYPGDRIGDAAPSKSGYLPSSTSTAPYCFVREQVRPQPATSYAFGRSYCSQAPVKIKKP